VLYCLSAIDILPQITVSRIQDNTAIMHNQLNIFKLSNAYNMIFCQNSVQKCLSQVLVYEEMGSAYLDQMENASGIARRVRSNHGIFLFANFSNIPV